MSSSARQPAPGSAAVGIGGRKDRLAAVGRPIRNPCPSSQPSDANRSNCSWVSTPVAISRSPSVAHSSTIVRRNAISCDRA